jgi:NADH:ubiquinone oxidoreductase subunit 4 (subunit M)
MSVARRRFLWTKPFVQPIVSAKLVIPTMIVLVGASVVDQESVQTRPVTVSVHRILSAIWINIVARRRIPAIGEIVVPKVAWVRSVGLTTTVGLEMSVVFLTNVLIAVALVVLQTQTAVPDITVVRKDSGMLVNLMCVVNIVLGNLVVQAMTVVARARLATLIVNAQLSITEALLRTLSHHG